MQQKVAKPTRIWVWILLLAMTLLLKEEEAGTRIGILGNQQVHVFAYL